MSTTITVNSNAEYLRWPAQCVCCGNPDETDVEVIVPDTIPHQRDLDEITSAHIPHCHECAAHSASRLPWMRVIAMLVAIAFADVFVAENMSRIAAEIIAFGGVVLVGITVAVDRNRLRRMMRRTCSASGTAYQFIHPSSEDITTITFTNDHFARAFRALNLGGAYEP